MVIFAPNLDLSVIMQWAHGQAPNVSRVPKQIHKIMMAAAPTRSPLSHWSASRCLAGWRRRPQASPLHRPGLGLRSGRPATLGVPTGGLALPRGALCWRAHCKQAMPRLARSAAPTRGRAMDSASGTGLAAAPVESGAPEGEAVGVPWKIRGCLPWGPMGWLRAWVQARAS